MGKLNKGVNTKVAAANELKAANKAKKDAVKSANKETKLAAEWSVGSDHRSKNKADKEELARQSADAKKAAKDAAAAADEEDIGKMKIKKVKKVKNDLPPELQAVMNKEKKKKGKKKTTKAGAKKAEDGPLQTAQKLAAKKIEGAEFEPSALPQNNTNRTRGIEATSGLESALSQLSTGPDLKEDAHPEKRMKAAYAAWEQRNLPRIKDEMPGLKLSQYKAHLFKEWKKSPENPMNAAGR